MLRKDRDMRQVTRLKIFVSINPRKASSKDPIGLNIDYIGKSIFGISS